MQLSIPSARPFRTSFRPGPFHARRRMRKMLNQFLVGLLLFLRDGYGNAHAHSGFDTPYPAIDTHRPLQLEMRGKTGSYPQRVGRFDKHSARAHIACVGAQHRGAPFDIEAGAEGVTRRPAPFQSARAWICKAHEAGRTPCLGNRAAAYGRSRRSRESQGWNMTTLGYSLGKSIRCLRTQGYDTVDPCFVPRNGKTAAGRYYSGGPPEALLNPCRRRYSVIDESSSPASSAARCWLVSSVSLGECVSRSAFNLDFCARC